MRPNRRSASAPLLLAEKSISSIVSLVRSRSWGKEQLLELHSHLISTSLIHHHSISTALLSRLRSPSHAFLLYRHMLRRGLISDPFTTTLVLNCSANQHHNLHHLYYSAFEQLHARTHHDGTRFDPILMTSLISVSPDASHAQKLFDEMPLRDTVTWNVLISTYTRRGRTRDALTLFEAMRSSSNLVDPPPPDDVTCLLAIRSCGHLRTLDLGEDLHSYVNRRGFGEIVKIRNALVAMYSRCGAVEKAVNVFRRSRQKNVVGWSALISGLASNGFGRDALAAFREMRHSGVPPDEQTFTAVISACAHCGFVDEGLRFLNIMRTEYRIAPNVRHYGCVVDLLGRAGLLHEAYGFITNEMDVDPDPTIWRTLLAACRVHCRFDLGERVIKHLIELKAHEAGDYVLLLNIYASIGNWEKVADIRKMMNLKGIQTSPGCSTLDLRGVVHEFVADDVSHPRKVEIHKMLDEIEGQLRIAGYVRNVEAELHDLDLEGKETALSYHSEKLALAFAVLETPPGTCIRIAKNIRTCVDCHDFMKVFSSVYDRVVIIGDRNRFHHFHRGKCSCNDYW